MNERKGHQDILGNRSVRPAHPSTFPNFIKIHWEHSKIIDEDSFDRSVTPLWPWLKVKVIQTNMKNMNDDTVPVIHMNQKLVPKRHSAGHLALQAGARTG